MKHTLRLFALLSVISAAAFAENEATAGQPVIRFDERYRHVRLAPVDFGVSAGAQKAASAEPRHGLLRWTPVETTGRAFKLGPARVEFAMGSYQTAPRYTMVTGLPTRDWTAGARVEFRF